LLLLAAALGAWVAGNLVRLSWTSPRLTQWDMAKYGVDGLRLARAMRDGEVWTFLVTIRARVFHPAWGVERGSWRLAGGPRARQRPGFTPCGPNQRGWREQLAGSGLSNVCPEARDGRRSRHGGTTLLAAGSPRREGIRRRGGLEWPGDRAGTRVRPSAGGGLSSSASAGADVSPSVVPPSVVPRACRLRVVSGRGRRWNSDRNSERDGAGARDRASGVGPRARRRRIRLHRHAPPACGGTGPVRRRSPVVRGRGRDEADTERGVRARWSRWRRR
jgi:hypothetical protein